MITACLRTLLSGGVLIGVSAVADVPDWGPLVDETLRRALYERYPGVTQWQVEPLLSAQQRASLQRQQAIGAEVTKLGKRSAVRITWSNAERIAKTTLWFSVTGLQPRLAAKYAIDAGQALSVQSAELAVGDILAASCTPVLSPQVLTNMRARRRMQAGTAICEESLEPRPWVERGATVQVRSTAGGVSIAAVGISQSDGVLGQTLQIKSPSSGELYWAAVVGRGEVSTHEP